MAAILYPPALIWPWVIAAHLWLGAYWFTVVLFVGVPAAVMADVRVLAAVQARADRSR